LEEKINSLDADIDKASRQNQELEKKLEFVSSEKEELINKLKEKLKAQPQPSPVPSQPQAEIQAVQQPIVPAAEDAYWAGILKAKTDLETQLIDTRNQLKLMQINSEQLDKDKSAFALEVKNLDLEKQDLKRQLEYNQKLMDSLAQELVREKNDKFKIQSNLDALRSESEFIKRQLKNANAHKSGLEKKLTQIQKEKLDLENKLGVMDSVLKDNISRVDNLKNKLEMVQKESEEAAAENKKESIELPPIVVRPKAENKIETATPEARKPNPSFSGKVLTLNKDNNFVIVDLGEAQDIRLGDIFQVYRGKEAIATIEVIQVRKEIAACDIKKETAPIKVGDIVR